MTLAELVAPAAEMEDFALCIDSVTFAGRYSKNEILSGTVGGLENADNIQVNHWYSMNDGSNRYSYTYVVGKVVRDLDE